MDQIKKKLAALKDEADRNSERADEAEAKVKKLEQQLLVVEQDNASLQHRLGLAEGEIDKHEAKVAELKTQQDHSTNAQSTNESLVRKVQKLEDDLEQRDAALKETMAKLRQVDVKAEDFERQLHRLEKERDAWEQKYEEMEGKYKASQKELDELVRSMGDI